MDNRFAAGKKVAMVGIAVNVVLLICKLFTGYASQSQAMIADGFNSMGDVFASLVTLFGSIYAAKPKDADHAFGHGKAEYIASLIIGFSMIVMSIYTISGSVTSLAENKTLEFSWSLTIVAVITIIAKALLFRFCIKMSKKHNSVLIKANAFDHRNDVFVTTGTLIAIFLSVAGFAWVDGAIGIIISVWIAYTGLMIIIESVKVLMDTGIEPKLLDECKNEILNIDGVDHIDSILAKPVGVKYILIVKISVDKNMTVIDSHKIAKDIETEILNKQEEIDDIFVHINPDLPHI
ncbi:MAG: cation diffusion facilitator family transporter [Christensenellaceae bacterium]